MPEAQTPLDLLGKACPFLPAQVRENKLTPGQGQVVFSPCMGDVCAIFDRCQGDFSPASRHLEIDELISVIAASIAEIPLVPEPTRERLLELSARFQVEEAPPPDPAPTSPAPGSGGGLAG